MQQVLRLLTVGGDLRDEVVGWGAEDPALYVPNKPIGMTPGPRFPSYGTVLEAMADNWHLLAPPASGPLGWSWMLVRTA